ncbi:hypothetical protein [Iamia sp.]|uniref:hypothetical protein n=1 Tax=Iamia sp. TaxID=2722710 RepID=UPI002B50A98D|nr:hypothetical protein [Iamia sp.]HXH56913.1 hypothetical protein [Iamia sp.]
MEPSDAAAQETIERVVRAGVAGRAVVVLVTAVRGAGPMVAALNEMGAVRVLVVAAGEGTGPPLDGAVRRIGLGHRATTMTQEVLAAETMTDELTADQHASLDAFDPDRTALVLGGHR